MFPFFNMIIVKNEIQYVRIDDFLQTINEIKNITFSNNALYICNTNIILESLASKNMSRNIHFRIPFKINKLIMRKSCLEIALNKM